MDRETAREKVHLLKKEKNAPKDRFLRVLKALYAHSGSKNIKSYYHALECATNSGPNPPYEISAKRRPKIDEIKRFLAAGKAPQLFQELYKEEFGEDYVFEASGKVEKKSENSAEKSKNQLRKPKKTRKTRDKKRGNKRDEKRSNLEEKPEVKKRSRRSKRKRKRLEDCIQDPDDEPPILSNRKAQKFVDKFVAPPLIHKRYEKGDLIAILISQNEVSPKKWVRLRHVKDDEKWRKAVNDFDQKLVDAHLVVWRQFVVAEKSKGRYLINWFGYPSHFSDVVTRQHIDDDAWNTYMEIQKYRDNPVEDEDADPADCDPMEISFEDEAEAEADAEAEALTQRYKATVDFDGRRVKLAKLITKVNEQELMEYLPMFFRKSPLPEACAVIDEYGTWDRDTNKASDARDFVLLSLPSCKLPTKLDRVHIICDRAVLDVVVKHNPDSAPMTFGPYPPLEYDKQQPLEVLGAGLAITEVVVRDDLELCFDYTLQFRVVVALYGVPIVLKQQEWFDLYNTFIKPWNGIVVNQREVTEEFGVYGEIIGTPDAEYEFATRGHAPSNSSVNAEVLRGIPFYPPPQSQSQVDYLQQNFSDEFPACAAGVGCLYTNYVGKLLKDAYLKENDIRDLHCDWLDLFHCNIPGGMDYTYAHPQVGRRMLFRDVIRQYGDDSWNGYGYSWFVGDLGHTGVPVNALMITDSPRTPSNPTPNWKTLETLFWIGVLVDGVIPSPAWFPQVIIHVRNASLYSERHQVQRHFEENGLFAPLNGIEEQDILVYHGVEHGYKSLEDEPLPRKRDYKPFAWLFGAKYVPDLKGMAKAKNEAFTKFKSSITDHFCQYSFCGLPHDRSVVGPHNPPKVWFHRGCAMAHKKAENIFKERAYDFFCPCGQCTGLKPAWLDCNGHVVKQKQAIPIKEYPKFVEGKPPPGLYKIPDESEPEPSPESTQKKRKTYIQHANQVVLQQKLGDGSKIKFYGAGKHGKGIPSTDPYGVFMMSFLRTHGDEARRLIRMYLEDHKHLPCLEDISLADILSASASVMHPNPFVWRNISDRELIIMKCRKQPKTMRDDEPRSAKKRKGRE